MSDATFIYNRKDGGTTQCYGTVQEDSNFDIVCDDEFNDGTYTDNNFEDCNTWNRVCKFLEAHYDAQIEQIEAV